MAQTMAADIKLLELLVCPLTGNPLIFNKKKKELISQSAKLAYPVKEGIPVLLVEEARPLTAKEAKSR